MTAGGAGRPSPAGAHRPPGVAPHAATGSVDRRRRGGCGPSGEETSRRLVEAGRTAFADLGYAAARVDDVVAIAGTSHGTFYLYFRNKEDLLHRLAVECGEDLDDLTAEMDDLADDDPIAVEAWVGRLRHRLPPAFIGHPGLARAPRGRSADAGPRQRQARIAGRRADPSPRPSRSPTRSARRWPPSG